MKKTLLLIFITVVFFSCKKNEQLENSTQPEKLGDNYQPTTKATYWKYNTASGTLTRTMTGETAVFRGKTYYKALNEYNYKDPAINYYCIVNGDYFMYQVDPIVGEIEQLYFKENAAIGDTWISNTSTLNGVEHQQKFTLIAKNITHVVLGKTYNNVIHVQILNQQKFPGSNVYTDAQTINQYIAKGIGIIDVNDITGPSIFKLTDYAIK